jgi:superfamily I DNA/RNA helicase
MRRTARADRIYGTTNTLNYVRFFDDYPVSPLNDVWTDTGHSGFSYEKLYVVQTATAVIQRCILMSTDPGDLVLDPTCGSRTLRVNYRTSHQIRTQADRLLGPVVTDVDGNIEDRSDTVSVFNGPAPTICSLKDDSEEIKTVANWIAERAKDGVLAHEFGVFVRSEAQLDRARAAVKDAGIAFKVLDEHVETASGHVSISTMHLAKGLEFRAVVVMACDDEIIPLQERIETVGDDADLQEVYDTERHLLYVACTRARDHLLVTGVDPVSEFLDDIIKGD